MILEDLERSHHGCHACLLVSSACSKHSGVSYLARVRCKGPEILLADVAKTYLWKIALQEADSLIYS
jgi:hypothetical protein